MSFSFDQIPEARALHYRFAFELLPRQFFKQSFLLWPALREEKIGQQSLKEIWKIAPKMHKNMEYLPIDGLELFYRDQGDWEIIEIQMPKVKCFPEASALYLLKHNQKQSYAFYAYIPQTLRGHWLRVEADLSRHFCRTKNISKIGERTEELLELIARN